MLPNCEDDASEDENPQPDVRNDSDSSYLGDVESLSCDSGEPSSDSEGDLSEMFSKGNIRKKMKHLLKLFILPQVSLEFWIPRCRLFRIPCQRNLNSWL